MNLKFLLFSFNGRISRLYFWMYHFVALTIFVALYIFLIEASHFAVFDNVVNGNNFLWIMYGFYILQLIPYYAVIVKRCHDRNHSWWFMFVSLIPLIGSIWLLIELGFLRGTIGDNIYGPDPLKYVDPSINPYAPARPNNVSPIGISSPSADFRQQISCPSCNELNEPDFKVCKSCGNDLTSHSE